MNEEQRQRIEKLYMQMFGKLMAYARSLLSNEALAEEAVQETFRIACQKPDQVCESVNPNGWLVQTLKYTICNMQSSQLTAKKLIEKYAAFRGKELFVSEDKIDVHVLYENVADTEGFQLLIEMAIEGRSHLEMAERRGITVSACKKRVQRAKEALQRKIKI